MISLPVSPLLLAFLLTTCVIYKDTFNDSDISALQTDINIITQWCNDWLMELNISRQINICPSYSLNNSTLLPVSSYEYVGVHISKDLSW
uniref:Putative endonuclease/reverse transcript n=1 Tax=Ixodes ricinus TaxID=34613 RepID=A0A0K8R7J1_IXORI